MNFWDEKNGPFNNRRHTKVSMGGLHVIRKINGQKLKKIICFYQMSWKWKSASVKIYECWAFEHLRKG